ncbi:3-oxoacyl-[acyl-carrier-protein] reductase [Fusibacter paucivorans]|uniref:3-oxoacyl-[acyl-carrier-protein] reductase n=1 Tax=Fusibacter paucivorans TaxID=76009 RepID=A0ABS5PSL9_9FIRM|nr:3-oxoacyl-[acyl-carrier-protein] reductase [Fusibacter paucivorans]MBS7528164.1 3-oxoacyl-[acyl-carrier-protein] reductase [Fusibacter paucivorans]
MKVAIVTGASRGIGSAIAKALSENGYNLVLNYRASRDELEALAATLTTEVVLVQGDVGSFEESEAIISAAKTHFGRVDLLVNNAGIARDNLIMRMSEADFDAVNTTNLKGTFNCTKHVSRMMVKQRFGRIINISSVVGIFGNAGQANYAASKAGIIGFTKAIAKELAPRNITVNAIAPGFIETQMTDAISEEAKTASVDRIPLARFGKPEDIAKAVVFLASDDANYITGQVIQVDGGMTL